MKSSNVPYKIGSRPRAELQSLVALSTDVNVPLGGSVSVYDGYVYVKEWSQVCASRTLRTKGTNKVGTVLVDTLYLVIVQYKLVGI